MKKYNSPPLPPLEEGFFFCWQEILSYMKYLLKGNSRRKKVVTFEAETTDWYLEF